jgi:hypothetical protein
MPVYRKKLCQLRCGGMIRKKTAMKTLSSSTTTTTTT